MSNTPETDYENIHHRLGWPAFASKLERERDMAREKLSHAQALLAEMQDALKLAVKQLLKQ